jgi:hypothetical protein
MERLTPDALRARIHAAIGEPEITRRGFDLGAAPARRRRWRGLDLGLGTAPAPVRAGALLAVVVAVAAALTVGTVLHLHSLPKPAGSQSGPAGTTTPTVSAVPTLGAGPLVTAADGFVPEDVTAVSADQWWVLGHDTAGCTGAACTRILVTVDGGQTFASIPTPPTAVTGLRFRDPEDGWAYSSTTVWSTHDAGARWSATPFPGETIEDLETSGSYVYAVVCASGAAEESACSLERSATDTDGWQSLSLPLSLPSDVDTFRYVLKSLNVHGGYVALAFWADAASGTEQLSRVLTSGDDGEHFTEASICAGSMGIESLYAVSSQDLWATCSTGLLVGVWSSDDGGAVFTEIPESSGFDEPNTGTIAATSATHVELAGTRLLVSDDGGQTFQVALDNGESWSIVGFTTSEAGFAFSSGGGEAGTTGLWRTVDAGYQWYEVAFP